MLMLILPGCSNSAKEIFFPVTPSELSDCKFYELENEVKRITVVRCPNSNTSANYKEGKTIYNSAVVEGSSSQ